MNNKLAKENPTINNYFVTLNEFSNYRSDNEELDDIIRRFYINDNSTIKKQ